MNNKDRCIVYFLWFMISLKYYMKGKSPKTNMFRYSYSTEKFHWRYMPHESYIIKLPILFTHIFYAGLLSLSIVW